MILSKGLIVKGFTGLAATSGVFALGTAYINGAFTSPSDGEKEDNLGIPKDCEQKCELTKEQLGKIKFETKTNDPITIEDLGEGEKVTLTIADISSTSDKTNYPKGKKYNFKTSTGKKAKIKGAKDGDIEITDGGVDFREIDAGGKLEKAPEEIDILGIPKSCSVGSSCQLTKDQLEKIKFETKDTGSSITVNGLENEKVTLTISNVSNNNEYPKGKKYSFKTSSTSKTATISGAKDDISITNSGVDFKEKQNANVLEKVTVVKQAQSITENTVGLPNNCKVDQVQSTGTTSVECQLGIEDLKKIKFKELGDTGAATVNGLTGSIKLTISWETGSDYPDNKKYSFENSSNTNDIKITNGNKDVTIAKKTESWFKNEGNKLALVDTKLGSQKKEKMREVNDELKTLGFSEKIQLQLSDFNKEDGIEFQKKEAQFDGDSLKKIQFKELNGTATKIVNLESTGKIKVELYYELETTKYPKNMKFVFVNNNGYDIKIENTENSKNIWIRKTESGKTSNEIFKSIDNKLERVK